MKQARFILVIILLLSSSMESKVFLVFGGKTGWIGKKITALLTEQGHMAICTKSRLENRESIVGEIKQHKPDFIINAAGITGRPTVDWCEDHKQETLRANVLGALNLVDVAYTFGIHVTNFATGCIYTYDDKHPENSGIGFAENEEPNFTQSFYSKTKVLLEKLILEYLNLQYINFSYLDFVYN